MIKPHKLTFFIDFDGTITKQDVGETLIKFFGNVEEINKIIQLWAEHKITSSESWQMFIDIMQDYNKQLIDDIIDKIDIDPFFLEFLELTKKYNSPVIVLSDGWDYYIHKIFEKFKITIPFYSNHVEFDSYQKLKITFPHRDDECNLCGNCKRNHLLYNSSDYEDEFTIYIGDGLSDKCPATFVDYIFAKGQLLKFLEKHRISYYPFSNFNDIISIVNNLISKKRLKKRHQAILNRKKFYLEG
ncbi:MAG TPA: MtnX-like HAD-IB family phosphatase [Ignavibacteriales bacterium]|nr:MtnX-like HAD-IB family phosphatase [Ignavibacteriales bacterium]HOL81313.1 MtnX-like HAD-IB family phosphatase [Ignavibacteriales bacterium]HOM66031.1 MtnX-like HAD-IB family phosphatase [Ignavibacteriales bacterium]HPD67523.1 MtnX-like HAD-IB family phosphatase [Ignavibacteriales bacterium]HPP33423.1 MtnX-like HAD-IB family phosphatase [Ignavibacteriales bacterium]